MRYTIRAVDRAGIPWTVCQTNHGDSALQVLRGLRCGPLFWVELTDDEEAGDVEARLEEQEEERKASK